MSELTAQIEARAGTIEPDVGDYVALLKPRVMSLVVFTALAGLVAAPGGLHPVVALASLVCIALGAGASGALNMWYDADIDVLMARTRGRPVPSGKVEPGEALALGLGLSGLSVAMLAVFANLAAAALLAFTIFFYAVVYTAWLKRSTPQNIVIGGAAGAFPPMIGWAAVTGDVSIASALMFLVIFLWTPPHFWALALFRNADYTRAGVPMMPVVAGERATRRQILVYAVLLVPVTLLPAFTEAGGPVCLAVGSIAAGRLVLDAWRVARRTGDGGDGFAAEKRLFGTSIVYLFAVFAAFIVEAILRAAGIAPAWPVWF